MSLFFEYKNFVKNYKPFPWEIDKDETRINFKDQHTFELNFIRFYEIFKKLKEVSEIINNPKIIDVGSYPGSMIKLCKHIFESISNYSAIGLDLDKKFIEEIKKFNVDCIDTEIDPNFQNSSTPKEWNLKNYDVGLLFDTIEHLVNPIFCLDQINNSLKKGGYLLITTDNITNIIYILKMILKGESPNINFILSSMFYVGNHRPHHREFSKNELKFLLEYSGFEIIKHEYFDREQGKYFLKNGKLIKKNTTFKQKIFDTIIKIFNFIPHFRNHQIIIAKKTKHILEVNRLEPTTSKKRWLEFRMRTIGY